MVSDRQWTEAEEEPWMSLDVLRIGTAAAGLDRSGSGQAPKVNIREDTGDPCEEDVTGVREVHTDKDNGLLQFF